MARRLIIVDGYNVVGAWWGLDKVPLERSRDRLLEVLGAYGVVKGHRLMVVFDGSVEVRRMPTGALHKGVEAYFTKGTSADDAILRLVDQAFGNCVVVTNDRELRRRCELRGGVVISCEDFRVYVARASRQAAQSAHDEKGFEARSEAESTQTSHSEEDGTSQWIRFLAEVEPLDGDKRPIESGAGDLPPMEALLERMLEVPDEVAKDRAREPHPSVSRRAPRAKKHAVARREAFLKDL